MTGSSQSRIHDRLRIAVLGGFLTLVFVEWLFLHPETAGNNAEGLTGSTDVFSVLPRLNAAPSAAAYDAIVTNDLFAEAREAPPAALARMAKAAPSTTPSGLRVIGIVTSGNERLALIQHGLDGDLLRVRVGDVIAGAKVVEIASTQIVLLEDGRRRILSIEHRDAANETMVVSADLAEAPPGTPRTFIGADGNFDQAAGKAVYDAFMSTRQPGVSARDPTGTANSAPSH